MNYDLQKLEFTNLLTKSQPVKPTLFVKKGGILSLSGSGLRDLLLAVFDRGMPFRFRARGFSMSPFIQDGDVITVAPFSGRKPSFGEVVAFIHPKTDKIVVHRVLRGQGNAWQLCGDNVSKNDGWVADTNIIGCVKQMERNGRTLRIGLGPERILIAFLKRRNWLATVLSSIFRIRITFLNTLQKR